MNVVIDDNKLCCGCSACSDICSKHAIKMVEDSEGFLYPVVDKDKCVDCGLCENICPTKNVKKNQSLLEAYAVYNTDENIRMMSSSGGIFTLLAELILNDNGIVYGAAFDDNFEVEHIRVETTGDLEKLRGSKYVQSKCDGIYKLCKKDLDDGKKVLFTGTPCQVAALKTFLKDYDNLFCMDIVCHGVPSRMVWRKYLEHRVNCAKNKIKHIAFRLKNEGWKQYAIKFTFADSIAYCTKFSDDIFMKGFLQDLYLRPSCYDCKFKSRERVSDITLADFWGIDKLYPQWDDDKGMSLVVVHSKKGENILEYISKNLFMKSVNLDDAINYNSAMIKSVAMNKHRDMFFNSIGSQENIESYIGSYVNKQYSLRKRISVWLRSFIKQNLK